MTAPRTRKRWLEVLRRTTGVDVAEARPALDDAGIWAASERVSRATQDAERLGERLAATAARQRTTVEAALERSSSLVARKAALVSDLALVSESLNRLGVVGLNAGLEGARVSEPYGKALTLVSDEVRAHVERASSATRELSAHIDEVATGLVELGQRIERTQRDAQELSNDAAQLKAVAQTSIDALSDLDARLRKATGLDPESAKLITLASEHAKGLLGALTALDGARAKEATVALLPVLGPVAKLLGSIMPNEPPSGSGAS